MTGINLTSVEKILGHEFRDKELLRRALTHRSWAYENKPKSSAEVDIRKQHNELLEFLGDAVLGLSIVEALHEKYEDASEGELTLMKHYLTSASVIAKVAEKLKLGDYIRISRGEEKTGGRKKKSLLADCFEAVIGALFLDAGYITARNFVRKTFADELSKVTPEASLDYKTLLQEFLQAQKRDAPKYRIIEVLGPPHKPTFYVEVSWDTGKAVGKGSSRKKAEMMAANIALEKIKQETE